MHLILFLINVTDPSSLPNIQDPTFPLPVPSLLNLCLWAPPYLESKQEMQKSSFAHLEVSVRRSTAVDLTTFWGKCENTKSKSNKSYFCRNKNQNLALPWPRLFQALRTRPAFLWSRSRRASLPSQSLPSILTIPGNLVLDSACRVVSQMW